MQQLHLAAVTAALALAVACVGTTAILLRPGAAPTPKPTAKWRYDEAGHRAAVERLLGQPVPDWPKARDTVAALCRKGPQEFRS